MVTQFSPYIFISINLFYVIFKLAINLIYTINSLIKNTYVAHGMTTGTQDVDVAKNNV